jgi:hypothetical protein
MKNYTATKPHFDAAKDACRRILQRRIFDFV